MRRQLVRAVIVRCRRPFRRADGTMVQFEDNAAVLTNEQGETKGSGNSSELDISVREGEEDE